MAMELDIATEVETVGHIHIRNQQRNGRKSLTTVQGIPVKYSLNKIIKYLKSQLNCNGTIVDDAEHGQIIQLHGDKRKEIADFLYEQGISERESIKVHGA
jgi:translation initiation factor 1